VKFCVGLQIMSKIMLIRSREGPSVTSCAFFLKPQKKLRLEYNFAQEVFRVKDCCGKIDKSYALDFYFYIQNKDPEITFFAEKNTPLNTLINCNQLDVYIMSVNPFLKEKGDECCKYYKDDDSFIPADHVHYGEQRRLRCCQSDGDQGTGEWLFIQSKRVPLGLDVVDHPPLP